MNKKACRIASVLVQNDGRQMEAAGYYESNWYFAEGR